MCLNHRIHSHKVFSGLAARGISSTGWFFGFKLHLVVNDRDEIAQYFIPLGNVDDRKPVVSLVRNLVGIVFGDKGYISQPLAEFVRQTFNMQLITKLRSNMKNQPMLMSDLLLLRKRAIIETIIDQLKNISLIEHSRHRSFTNFVGNVLCGLAAYSHRLNKLSLGLGKLYLLSA